MPTFNVFFTVLLSSIVKVDVTKKFKMYELFQPALKRLVTISMANSKSNIVNSLCPIAMVVVSSVRASL